MPTKRFRLRTSHARFGRMIIDYLAFSMDITSHFYVRPSPRAKVREFQERAAFRAKGLAKAWDDIDDSYAWHYACHLLSAIVSRMIALIAAHAHLPAHSHRHIVAVTMHQHHYAPVELTPPASHSPRDFHYIKSTHSHELLQAPQPMTPEISLYRMSLIWPLHSMIFGRRVI